MAAEADGTTALHWAVRQGDGEIVDRLLRAGVNVAAANRYGVTPLHLAAVNGDTASIKRLLDAGADVKRSPLGAPTARPSMTVARGGHIEAARLLIERHANLEAREAWHGQTALDVGRRTRARSDADGAPGTHGATSTSARPPTHRERQVTAEPRDKWLPPGGSLRRAALPRREGRGRLHPGARRLKAGADVNASPQLRTGSAASCSR